RRDGDRRGQPGPAHVAAAEERPERNHPQSARQDEAECAIRGAVDRLLAREAFVNECWSSFHDVFAPWVSGDPLAMLATLVHAVKEPGHRISPGTDISLVEVSAVNLNIDAARSAALRAPSGPGRGGGTASGAARVPRRPPRIAGSARRTRRGPSCGRSPMRRGRKGSAGRGAPRGS